jgi:urea carboxylase-associated protein 2
MRSLDGSTPEQHRARYLELKRKAAERLQARAPGAQALSALRPLTDDEVRLRDTIPEGWYWTGRIRRGEVLRIVNTSGFASVSALLWNAGDASERYNSGDTVKIQWSASLGKGCLLFSDMGRVLASIIEDSGAGHDALVGGSTMASNAERYGAAPMRNTRDNFCAAAAKLGLTRRDIMPCVTFFASVRTTDAGAFEWRELRPRKPGDFVELRAEMDVLIALSNCPHPFDPRPDYAPGCVDVTVWRGAPPDAGDLCRTMSEDAVRGFENTDALFGA